MGNFDDTSPQIDRFFGAVDRFVGFVVRGESILFWGRSIIIVVNQKATALLNPLASKRTQGYRFQLTKTFQITGTFYTVLLESFTINQFQIKMSSCTSSSVKSC